jgi:hypothetical protein
MKNNTKVRLHLSKKLFESLTREIIKEAKANDGYTVAVKQPKQVKEVNAVEDTDKMKKMEEKMSSKEKMAKGLYSEVDAEMDTDKMEKIKEMEMNVAEEGQMNEMTDAISWEAVAAGMAAMGLAPLAIDKMHKWWQKKYPKSFKKAQGLSGAIDKQMGGNTPGQGHGVDTKKSFGPQNEKDNLKEYENDDYRVVNGECRRYNDEHEYVVVSMSNCR